MSQPSSSRVRRGVVALALAAILGAGTAVAGPGLAVAAPPSPSPSPHKPLAMGTFAARDYAAAAAKLPAGLTQAVSRDVHLTGAQYLADAAAAIRAPKVVGSLRTAGVHVLGSRIDGTKLTVNVASKSDVAVVDATGATAVVGAPKVRDFSKMVVHAAATTDTYGGEGYFFQEAGQTNGNGIRCSIGFNGYSVATGAPQFATAGHCATTIPSNHSAYLLSETKPFDAPGGGGAFVVAPLGTTVAGEAQYGSGRDYGIISSGDAGVVTHNSVATWGTHGSLSSPSVSGGTPLASLPQGITGQTVATVGAILCKSGSSSGWTCGEIEAVDYLLDVSDKPVNTIIATTCMLPGDSGGGAVIGTEAAGIDSGSAFPASSSDTEEGTVALPNGFPCGNPNSHPELGIDDPGFYSVFFPMVSDSTTASVRANSVQGQQGARWQLGVSGVTGTPTVSSPSTGSTVYTAAGSMSGSLSGATSSSTAILYLDGSTTPFAKANASSGAWSIPLTGMRSGAHTYTLSAGFGWSPGNSVTGSFTAEIAPPVPARLSGGVGDFNSDGNQDLIARDSAGTLWLYPGNGSGGFLSRVKLGTGWKPYAILPVGDFDGDGNPDLIARDSAGRLWLYPGNGNAGFGARSLIASGWSSYTAIYGVADFTGDGNVDIVARDKTGRLFLFPGSGTGQLGTRVQIGSGWSSYAIYGVGDFTGDGKSDFVTRDSTGRLWIYPGNGAGGFGARIQIGTGWTKFALYAAGDLNKDGAVDLLARDSTGKLWLYPGSGTGHFLGRVQVGSGWSSYAIY